MGFGAHFLFVDGKGETVQALDAIVRNAVEAVGFEYVGCEYHSQGKHSVLRVYIDSPKGVNVDDCSLASRHISAVLDVEEPIPSHYNLEVSSPGIDRPLFTLEQCQKVIGQEVKVKLADPIDKQRNFAGTLVNVEAGDLVLEIEGEQVVLPFDRIQKANVMMRHEL